MAGDVQIILFIPMLMLGCLVRINLESPVLFRDARPGLHGKPFLLIKFRTISNERSRSRDLLPDAQRLSAFGAFLRSTSLDEMPEPWNVLKGGNEHSRPSSLVVEVYRAVSCIVTSRQGGTRFALELLNGRR